MRAVRLNRLRPFSAGQWARIQGAVGATPDGAPGPQTAQAILAWQEAYARRLSPEKRKRWAVDGIPGRETIRALGLPVEDFFGASVIRQRHPGRLIGIDVSKYQTRIAWDEVGGAIDFAWVKLSQHDFRDPRWADHVDGARRLGLAWGGYHLVEPLRGAEWLRPEREAEVFLRQLGDLTPPLGLALDLERGAIGRAQEARGSIWVSDYLEHLIGLLEQPGLPVSIYGSHGTQALLLPRPGLVARSRWVVDYQARGGLWLDAPTLGKGWEAAPWVWRQVSEEGAVPGVLDRQGRLAAVDIDIAREGWTCPTS